jgi:hypothetical protein
MANHHRILIVVFAHEPQPMQSFLDALKSGGWRAHVEIPVPHEGECGFLKNDVETGTPVCGRCEYRAWGSMLFPDIRILTQEGVSEIDDCRHLPDFQHDHPFTQANAVISGCSYPGFQRPEPTDHIAVLIAESRGGVPHQWFQKVIEANYEAGLRFFARCTDLSDLADSDGDIVPSTVFYTSDGAKHYAALTEEPVRESADLQPSEGK